MIVRPAVLAFAGVLITSSLVASQSVPQQPPAPLAAGRGLNQGYNVIKANLSESVDKMPDAEFGFRPTPDVRSYGEILGHVSNAGFATCASLLGEPNPNKDNLEQKSAKIDIATSLKNMFTYCDKALASVTDQNAVELIRIGPREVARVVPAANLIAHLNEHYGNLVTYMRLKGIVPPSTERAARR